MVDKIRLNRVWMVGSRLAGGGFGEVFEAESDTGEQAVMKLIPKDPGAERELLFKDDLTGVPNVIPIWDTGEWNDHWTIVMPRAEKSLKQHLADSGGALAQSEVVEVLTDIAEALDALDGRAVHRDLKPANILYYQGHWCLADFGIARYAEATTAPDTRKFALTAQYAAPEQWRFERGTTATDVYAAGVSAFEMLAGRLPFEGPDFRNQHLNEPPPSVPNCPPALASLVSEMMYKASGARPTAANLLQRLRDVATPASGSLSLLQQVNQELVEERARQDATVSAAKSEEARRVELFESSRIGFQAVMGNLAAAIEQGAPGSGSTAGRYDYRFTVGRATLTIQAPTPAPINALSAYNERAPFDVIAHSQIGLEIADNPHHYDGRAHSLWYCDAQEEDSYRWFETAFMVMPLIARRARLEPFAMSPEDGGSSLANVIGEFQLAWPFVPIDQGEEADFIQRWVGWLAQAAAGRLAHPSNMPERDPRGSWRKK